MNRILIVAAYASVRAGMHALLSEWRDEEIVGYASGEEEMRSLLFSLRPNVVLFDGGSEEMLRIACALAETAIGLVALTEDREDAHLLATIGLRSWGWLRKEADGVEISGAVTAAAAGLIALDPSLMEWLAPLEASVSRRIPVEGLPGEALTAREREVLQLLAQGLPNKMIGVRLNISLYTAKFHVASILAKLGAASRTEAVAVGARRGYVTL